MKQFSIPKTCPICGKEYYIKTLECNGCHTKLEGKFAPGVFSNLDAEQTEFVLLFLKNHGNIQKVGKDLGISYPTVKSRINKVLKALGQDTPNEDILTMLKNDEITIDEAVDAIVSGK
ncbi:MAG: DUF2089 domain-containing protein [Clostridia bacterium]|nr:DUF2089 domain-containing protein [Clostridia bacterium]